MYMYTAGHVSSKIIIGVWVRATQNPPYKDNVPKLQNPPTLLGERDTLFRRNGRVEEKKSADAMKKYCWTALVEQLWYNF